MSAHWRIVALREAEGRDPETGRPLPVVLRWDEAAPADLLDSFVAEVEAQDAE